MSRLVESIPLLTDALDARFGTEPELSDPGPSDRLSPMGRLLVSLGCERNWLDHLDSEGLLDPATLAAAETGELVESFRVASLKLRPSDAILMLRVARWLVERHHGDFDEIESLSTATLREELRQIRGLGVSTVETVLLDGLDRFSYPLDRATFRILVRHGWIDPWAEFDDARELMENALASDPSTARRWSHWMIRLGRHYCKPAKPSCDDCPLRIALPESGPLELNSNE